MPFFLQRELSPFVSSATGGLRNLGMKFRLLEWGGYCASPGKKPNLCPWAVPMGSVPWLTAPFTPRPRARDFGLRVSQRVRRQSATHGARLVLGLCLVQRVVLWACLFYPFQGQEVNLFPCFFGQMAFRSGISKGWATVLSTQTFDVAAGKDTAGVPRKHSDSQDGLSFLQF